jgi:hydroxyacylglutathione hydrolase
MSMEVVIIPCLSDNYAYLLRDAGTGKVGLVDAPEPGPIDDALSGRGWRLDTIFVTHHHDDHIAGVEALRSRHGAEVVGNAADARRLPRLDRPVEPGDEVVLGGSRAVLIDVPGHTVGHVAYHFAEERALFSADSLMVMGCGRLFEGSAEAMWDSLSRLAALPPETRVYSGHEYAESNVRFALSVDGDNPALRERAEEIRGLRAARRPTVPGALAAELATNPFLRARDPDMKHRLGMADAPDAAVFAEIRRRKDSF